MAVPKRRTSRSKRNIRRANHDKVTVPNLSPCPNCGEPAVAHRGGAHDGRMPHTGTLKDHSLRILSHG